jgi:hypothetical protein
VIESFLSTVKRTPHVRHVAITLFLSSDPVQVIA